MNARTDNEFLMDGDTAQLRTPPHSIEAETSVLGSLLLDNGGWDRIGDLLTETDFYRHEHRVIFSAIAGMINACKPADVVTVFADLQRAGKTDQMGGMTYLHSLAQTTFSFGSLRRYAEIVRERSVLRKLIAGADEISANAFNAGGKSADAILESAVQTMMGIAPEGAADEWEGMDTGMVKLLDRITAQYEGTAALDFIPTGLTVLDERLDGGMRRGELIIIGARPSMGKSALALSIGMNVALDKHPVGMFSMEMPRAQVHARAMSMVSQIHLSRIKRAERLNNQDWPRITSAIDKLRNVSFHVSDFNQLNINQLRTRSRRLVRRCGKLGCLIIDYLGLMDGLDSKMSRNYQLEEVTKGLKSLAKELDCPILLLCQLSREVEKRPDPTPMLSDLRDAGSIEQDADIVLFVHRPYKAKPDLADEWKPYAKVSVAKLRDGEPGAIDLMYIGENTHFIDWPEDMPVPTNSMRLARAGGGL